MNLLLDFNFGLVIDVEKFKITVLCLQSLTYWILVQNDSFTIIVKITINVLWKVLICFFLNKGILFLLSPITELSCLTSQGFFQSTSGGFLNEQCSRKSPASCWCCNYNYNAVLKLVSLMYLLPWNGNKYSWLEILSRNTYILVNCRHLFSL